MSPATRPAAGDENLLAVEPLAGADARRMALFFRQGAKVVQTAEPFTPFIVVETETLLKGCPVPAEFQALRGKGRLRALARFAAWSDWEKAKAWLTKIARCNATAPEAPFLIVNDPVQQFLTLTGRTLFKGLLFEQLRRMQVDIETHTAPGFEFSNPEREDDGVIVIALGDESGWQETLWDRAGDEKRLLERFTRLVRERDPDVIEGHNIFKFDLAYLSARAARHGVALALGRDGSALRSHPSRYSAGERTIAFPKFEIFGRHIVDTFFLLQAYDISHRSLAGFGLKDAALHFNLAAKDRVYIEGPEIARTFARDPERVVRYAADDIRETRALSAVLSRTYFLQAQTLPFSFHNVCLRGNAAKIDALMLREYLRRGQALPMPEKPREFEGGYTDLFAEGVIRNVHHCDVRSLYPSIMLTEKIAPAGDDLGAFLQLLDSFRAVRMEARHKAQQSGAAGERAHYEARQAAFKVLINSFYGYLGFAQARFNDFAAAARVTAAGRAIIGSMLDWLKTNGARPIEVDTDGIYFVPPDFKSAADRETFRAAFQRALPPGIEIEFDGEFVSMFSYKMKNYALLDDAGEIVIKGAALKSRGLEPYLREFLRDYIRLKLEFRDAEIPRLKAEREQAIAGGGLPIQRLAKTETLKDAPESYAAKIAKGGRGRNAAYELALRSGRKYQAGDQVSYYIVGAKKNVAAHQAARLASDWNPAARDENTAYYVAKLDALFTRLTTGAGLEGAEDSAAD